MDGYETNVFDADVHAQLLHYQRNQAVGSSIWFSLRELAEDLDLAPNGRNLQRVRESIERLRDTTIDLRFRQGDAFYQYRGQLVLTFFREEHGSQDRWAVELSKQLIPLLAPGTQARYHVETDRRLKSNLAKYLLRFYATQTQAVFPMKVDTLRKFTGTHMPIRDFRRALKEALDELQEVGVVTAWAIEDDKVRIVRPGEAGSLTHSKEA